MPAMKEQIENTNLRKEDHASSEYRNPDELKCNGDTVRGVIRSVLGSVCENVGDEDPKSDHPLE